MTADVEPAGAAEQQLRLLAIAAAEQAAGGAAELLRYAREGAAFVTGEPFDDDAVMKLCDAAKMALEIELGAEVTDRDADEREALNQALGALQLLLEGWA
ncbi:MAG: hypothetical protein E5X38_07200 [Mesorhizobium sp.]|uniref:hypothetical protein n=1 Tax=unclassified Mesorhizobium TaxID=325217 RepID=UPI000FCC8718|nr:MULTISPECIES: hypothetical protein [unclassified Mesorhizobium]RUV13565.1 hypothetical protein EOA91_25935 [Mesorhizobium sp. M1A.F.Ca.IN.022.04.1.1]RUV63521.1 hypothetical protein EOA64_08925 [Mesorhizobium sp. M1A.F.Ca.IN.022.02.1.1]RWG27385.1 MAG: hypothetical protein EOQ60_25555 [Mesorhizobium sp.]RWH26992.1 MAG: hypothetical protein EOQ75_03640 [Mesorhizobium sp.]TIM35983.1 MAG: hypothetical protein E5Y45_00275 [Mesorhizobium sp.]